MFFVSQLRRAASLLVLAGSALLASAPQAAQARLIEAHTAAAAHDTASSNAANTAANPAVSSAPIIALTGGQLLDGHEGSVIANGTIVIQGKTILDAGPAHQVAIPEGAHIISTHGRTMMPGLIDLHIHLDLLGHGDYGRYYDFIKGESRLDEIYPLAAKQLLRAGVTTAADLGSPLSILKTKADIEAGLIPGPRLKVSGPWITRIKLDGVPDSYQLVITSPKEAAEAVDYLAKSGVDVVKTWLGLTQADLDAVVKAAHEHGLKVHSHLYTPESLDMALKAGVDVFQHVGSARTPAYPDELVSRIAHKRVPVVQTISHRIWVAPQTRDFPTRLTDPRLKDDLPADLYAEMQDSFKNWQRLSYFQHIGDETRGSKLSAHQFIEAGAYMGVGTDAASPLNFHLDAMATEMQALTDVGMTRAQVLHAATKTGAEVLDLYSQTGTIEPGKIADIIVVNGNPMQSLEALKHVDLTISEGRFWFDAKRAPNPFTPMDGTLSEDMRARLAPIIRTY